MGQCLDDRCRVTPFNDVAVKEKKSPQLSEIPKYIGDRRSQSALPGSRQSVDPQHRLLVSLVVRPLYNKFQDIIPSILETLGALRRVHVGGLQLIEDILAACIVYDQTDGQQRTSRQTRWRLTEQGVDYISASIVDRSVLKVAAYLS
jgi:hypothetical protein